MRLGRNFSARNRARNLRRTPYQSQNRHYPHWALLTGQSMKICELKECDYVFSSENEYLVINRLNSGIKNRHNFFLRAIFLFLKVGNESVNYADSRDIKTFV